MHTRQAALILVLATTVCAQGLQSDSDRRENPCGDQSARILILGVYHMDNPGLDSVNLEADDVLSARRQAEISELLDKLARFKPTKIAIEAPYIGSHTADLYGKYLSGERRLGRNEIDQIAFQLARCLGLPAVSPIDYPMFMSGLTPDEIEQPRAETPAPAKPPASAGPRQLSAEDLLLRRSTVVEYLRHLNDEKQIEAGHAPYMEMLMPNGNAAIYSRADLVTNWYKRNLRMFANLCRITEFPKDRVLLIVGAGHLKILKEFALDAPQFCLVDTEAYLK